MQCSNDQGDYDNKGLDDKDNGHYDILGDDIEEYDPNDEAGVEDGTYDVHAVQDTVAFGDSIDDL